MEQSSKKPNKENIFNGKNIKSKLQEKKFLKLGNCDDREIKIKNKMAKNIEKTEFPFKEEKTNQNKTQTNQSEINDEKEKVKDEEHENKIKNTLILIFIKAIL